MAIATSNQPLTLSEIQPWSGDFELLDSSTIVVAERTDGGGNGVIGGGRGGTVEDTVVAQDPDSGRRTVYSGEFSSNGGIISGVLNSVEEFRDGILVYSLFDIGADANTFFEALRTPETYEYAASITLAGQDTIFGSSGGDELRGYAGEDEIFGGAGDDILIGMSGNDLLDGGPGVDTAVFAGNQNFYTLFQSNTGVQVYDRDENFNSPINHDDSDFLIDIEFLDFGENVLGRPFEIAAFNGLLSLSQDQVISFIELYIAYFNRAPDAIGLNFWGTAFAQGTSLEQMASLFIDQDETRSIYDENTSNTVFVSSVFSNVLGRLPDQAGIEFWVTVLSNGSVTRDQFILEVIRGAKSDLKVLEGQAFVDQQLADRAFLENKVTLGAEFALERGMSNVANASAVMSMFDGTFSSHIAAIDAMNEMAFGDDLTPADAEFALVTFGVLDRRFYKDPEVFVVPDAATLGAIEIVVLDQEGSFGLPAPNANSTGYLSEVSLLAFKFSVDGQEINVALPDLFGVSYGPGVSFNDLAFQVSIATQAALQSAGLSNLSFKVSTGTPTQVGINNQFTLPLVITFDVDADRLSANSFDIFFAGYDVNGNSATDTFGLLRLVDNQAPTSTTVSKAIYFLLDETAEQFGNPNRLNNTDIDGIRFEVTDNRGATTSVVLEADAANVAGTHQGFVNALLPALQATIDAGILPRGMTLTVDPSLTDRTFLNDGSLSADIPAIVLSTNDGSIVTATGFSRIEEQIGEFDVYGRFESLSEITDQFSTYNRVAPDTASRSRVDYDDTIVQDGAGGSDTEISVVGITDGYLDGTAEIF